MSRGRELLIDQITPEVVGDFTENYQSPVRELSSLFEIRDSDAIIAEAMLLSEDGETTPMASVHARNTSVKIAGRPNFEKLKAESLLIKEAIDVTAVQQAFMENGMGDPAFFFNNIFNNFQRRMDAVRDRRYAMATEPLSTGSFSVFENNIKLDPINIGFNPDNFMFTDWSSPDADIIGDFKRLHAIARKRGRPVTRGITSTKVAMQILTNKGIQDLYKMINLGVAAPAFSAALAGAAFERVLNNVMTALFGVSVILNDEILTMMNDDGTISEYRVYDENKITFFGGELTSRIGLILAGRTEEELMRKEGVIRAADGVATYRWDSENPPRRMLQAATVALPLYPGIKNMYIMTVLPKE